MSRKRNRKDKGARRGNPRLPLPPRKAWLELGRFLISIAILLKEFWT